MKSGLNKSEVTRLYKEFDELSRTMDDDQAIGQCAVNFNVDEQVIRNWMGSRERVEYEATQPFSTSVPVEDVPAEAEAPAEDAGSDAA